RPGSHFISVCTNFIFPSGLSPAEAGTVRAKNNSQHGGAYEGVLGAGAFADPAVLLRGAGQSTGAVCSSAASAGQSGRRSVVADSSTRSAAVQPQPQGPS